MVKDRLDEFVKARDSKGKKKDVKVDINSNANKDGKSKKKETKIDISQDEPSGTPSSNNDLKRTFETADVIKYWIESIEENVITIKQYLNKLDDFNVNQKDLNDKIDSLFQNNTSVAHKINAKLKQIEQDLSHSTEQEEATAEGRIKRIQFNTSRTRFQKIFRENNAELEHYRNIKKNQLDAQLRAKGVRCTDEELVTLLEEKADIQVFTENILAESTEAKRMLRDIEERHQQLVKIERMLVDVRDMFLEMSILVSDQQELIDRVEFQADTAIVLVKKGQKNLKNGEEKKRKHLKWKIILIVLAIVLIALILVLVFK